MSVIAAWMPVRKATKGRQHDSTIDDVAGYALGGGAIQDKPRCIVSQI
ncbi:hypothetical protein ECP03052938_2378 [Escherichia coli p0305293.8]|nr:hypothetical protein [Escherichia coli]ENG71446.1 hypothetical protein ECP03052938_2378 [Escherichia coli p0305293.8]